MKNTDYFCRDISTVAFTASSQYQTQGNQELLNLHNYSLTVLIKVQMNWPGLISEGFLTLLCSSMYVMQTDALKTKYPAQRKMHCLSSFPTLDDCKSFLQLSTDQVEILKNCFNGGPFRSRDMQCVVFHSCCVI